MLPPTLQKVVDAGHVVFLGDLSVNIVLTRRTRNTPGEPTDTLECWWMERGAWRSVFVPCDTEPGIRYLETPLNPKGTAILAAGQYRASHELGNHRGRPALVQRAPVRVYRDADRDAEVDYDGPDDDGLFGINIHDGSPEWSAGCPVAPVGLEAVIAVCELSRRRYGPRFSVTLIEDLTPTDIEERAEAAEPEAAEPEAAEPEAAEPEPAEPEPEPTKKRAPRRTKTKTAS